MTDWIEIGPCKLACGDCLQILPEIEAGSIDCVVTDPPYGVEGGHGCQLHDYRKADYEGNWKDDAEYIRSVCVPAINKCRIIAQAVALTPGTRHCFEYPPPDDMGCFWSPAAARIGKWGFQCFHPILYYGRYHRAGKAVWPTSTTMNERAPQNGHPCPKPVKAWEWLVEKVCPEGGSFLDCFMGSGTGGEIAVKSGRRFIGIEISPQYFKIAAKRIQTAWENRQGRLF